MRHKVFTVLGWASGTPQWFGSVRNFLTAYFCKMSTRPKNQGKPLFSEIKLGLNVQGLGLGLAHMSIKVKSIVRFTYIF